MPSSFDTEEEMPPMKDHTSERKGLTGLKNCDQSGQDQLISTGEKAIMSHDTAIKNKEQTR